MIELSYGVHLAYVGHTVRLYVSYKRKVTSVCHCTKMWCMRHS